MAMLTYRYDQSCVLRGQVYTDYFYGRPNYGESPETDELENPIFLSLDQAISVLPTPTTQEGDYRSNGYENITQVQIAAGKKEEIELLRNFRGHGIEIEGTLFPAHTGHHHSSVLLHVEKLPRSIDERQTYSNAVQTNTGTGFLLGREGLVCTAAHVIAGRLGITITRGLYRCKATVEYCDTDIDIAILKISQGGYLDFIRKSEEKSRAISIWTRPQLGERVYTFGFPLRPVLPHSLNMTEGIVSAEVGLDHTRFQISNPIQKGNSGGPVCDKKGNLIGIIKSKLLPTEEFTPENVNFATDAAELVYICKKLKIDLDTNAGRSNTHPVILAKLMQNVCFEVECWDHKGVGI